MGGISSFFIMTYYVDGVTQKIQLVFIVFFNYIDYLLPNTRVF